MNLINKTVQFLAFVDANKGIIYKIANSYCKDGEDRKDLVQEIIIQLWKSFDNYNEQYRYSTWLYKIALNVSISFYRKDSKKKSLISPITDSILFFEDNREFSKNEELELLQKFIQDLKELDRAIMLLYLDERSYKEIAETIGISETNVATKIGRIKKVLKLKFQQINN